MYSTTQVTPTLPAPLIMRRVKSGDYEYIGWASTGTAETTPNWQITRNTYLASDSGISAVDFANNSTAFNQVWTNCDSVIVVWG